MMPLLIYDITSAVHHHERSPSPSVYASMVGARLVSQLHRTDETPQAHCRKGETGLFDVGTKTTILNPQPVAGPLA